MSVTPLEWKEGKLLLLDQRKLPITEEWLHCKDEKDAAAAITDMVVRGAPLIGMVASYGLALYAYNNRELQFEAFKDGFHKAGEFIKQARPTAVNLFWAIDRMNKMAERYLNADKYSELGEVLLQEAHHVHEDDRDRCQKMGDHSVPLFKDNCTIMTYCNAGALATGGQGTALGVIRSVHKAGKLRNVYSCETRPYLQGARLTSYELYKDDIPVTLICDNMAATMMAQGKVDYVVVGSDRIARNGDVANKIGTLGVAVLAKHYNIPFYVAVPLSTIDINCPHGDEIPIEERAAEEISQYQGHQITLEQIKVSNPAFDVTPAELVAGIITERGVIETPNEEKVVAHTK